MTEEKVIAPEEAKVNESSEQPTQPELSPMEITKLKSRRANWYKEQINFLKPEADYQELLARIEVAKFNSMNAQFQQAKLYAQVNPPKEELKPEEVTTSETLKES